MQIDEFFYDAEDDDELLKILPTIDWLMEKEDVAIAIGLGKLQREYEEDIEVMNSYWQLGKRSPQRWALSKINRDKKVSIIHGKRVGLF